MLPKLTPPYRLATMVLATAGAAAVVFTSPLLASRPSCTVNDGTVHLEVLDRERGYLPVYRHRGESFLEGVNGNRYELLVCNPTPERVLAVVSVDGVNVVSGETATVQQGGYVVAPYGQISIAGWRKSMDRVAAFYFSSVGDSYAGRTGRPANVGVIGAAFFHEIPPPPPPIILQPEPQPLRERQDFGSSANRSEAPPAPPRRGRSCGSAHGERIDGRFRRARTAGKEGGQTGHRSRREHRLNGANNYVRAARWPLRRGCLAL